MEKIYSYDNIPEEIINRYDCPIDELNEADYFDILQELTNDIPEKAWYDRQLDAIAYECEKEEKNNYAPHKAFTEEYLNTLGMSRKEF